jgi:hypothetical protein
LVWFLTVTPLTNGMTKFGREKKKSGGNTVAWEGLWMSS